MAIDGVFAFAGEVVSESHSFLVGAVGGGFPAKGIADGVDVFGGSFKIFVDENAGVLVFDFGVFEAVV